jgi:hypothetical protein
MSRELHVASLLVRWLLPSNDLGMGLQKTLHVIATICCCVTSLRMHKLREHKENITAVFLAACVAGVACQWIYMSHYSSFFIAPSHKMSL